ncbi:hypothetical protein [Amycolatopsis plumensis]|uniref:Uncharacterized protein n=1 Tax=Amycolatopsis plumensis TaxID=236508 RepID=A0ABV5U427_9PSEU
MEQIVSKPHFKYNLRALNVSPQRFPDFIERCLTFAGAQELASHLSQTKAGDYVVAAALRLLDFAALLDSINTGGYEGGLCVKLSDGIGKSVLFSFPLIGGDVRRLNVSLMATEISRPILSSLANSPAGRQLSVKLMTGDWDWASRIYLDSLRTEETGRNLTFLANSPGGQELARALAATDGGVTFLRMLLGDRRFVGLGAELLKSDERRRFLVDFCGTPAVVGFVERLVARDDASELMHDVLDSRYVSDILSPLLANGGLQSLLDDLSDSARRSSTARKIADLLAEDIDDEVRLAFGQALLATFFPSVMAIWLAGLGVVVTVQVVYLAAVIAVTDRDDVSNGVAETDSNEEDLWIPHAAGDRPPPDSDTWRKVIGARLDERGAPSVSPADLENNELLAGAIYRFLATKNVGRPSSSHQDKVLLQLLVDWYLRGESDVELSQGQRLHRMVNLLYADLADRAGLGEDQILDTRQQLADQTGMPVDEVMIVDLARSIAENAGLPFDDDSGSPQDEPPAWLGAVERAVQAAVKGSTRDRWVQRLDGLLVNLAASGIGGAIGAAVSALMGLAPYEEAQIFEIDARVAYELPRWRQSIINEDSNDTWTQEDELALIFAIHALSVITICGAYARRDAPAAKAEVEMFTPPLRLNTEFVKVAAENMGMNVFHTG